MKKEFLIKLLFHFEINGIEPDEKNYFILIT